MAQRIYLLLLFAQIVHSQLTSLPSCAESCYARALSASNCVEDNYKCYCQSSVFHRIFICCVRAQCDVMNTSCKPYGLWIMQWLMVLVVGSEAVALCNAAGVSVTLLPSSACSGTSATNTRDTVTATATVTQIANSNSNSNSNNGNGNNNSFSLDTSGKNSGKPKLSTGAKAGIGAGVGGGVLAILAVIAGIIFKNRQKTSQTRGHDQSMPTEYKSELDTTQNRAQPGLEPDVLDTAVYGPVSPVSPNANELHSHSSYSYQLPTAENSAELYQQSLHRTQYELPGHQNTRYELQGSR